MNNQQNIAPDVSGMDPAATGQQVDVLVSQVSELVTALREAIPLLESAQKDETPMPYIAVLPTDGSSQGTALLIPSESMSLDQENLFKSIGKAMRKVDWGKVLNVVGSAAQGAMSGAALGVPGIIAGAATAGLGAALSGGPPKPPAGMPAMQPPAGMPVMQPPAGMPVMQPAPMAGQPAPAPMAGINIAQLAQLVPFLSQAVAGAVQAPGMAAPAAMRRPGEGIAIEAHVTAPPCTEYHHAPAGLACHAEHGAEAAEDEEGFDLADLVGELQRVQQVLLESLPEGGSFVWTRD
jgi:hypothetical protein